MALFFYENGWRSNFSKVSELIRESDFNKDGDFVRESDSTIKSDFAY